jgi:hypothetical protein
MVVLLADKLVAQRAVKLAIRMVDNLADLTGGKKE